MNKQDRLEEIKRTVEACLDRVEVCGTHEEMYDRYSVAFDDLIGVTYELIEEMEKDI